MSTCSKCGLKDQNGVYCGRCGTRQVNTSIAKPHGITSSEPVVSEKPQVENADTPIKSGLADSTPSSAEIPGPNRPSNDILRELTKNMRANPGAPKAYVELARAQLEAGKGEKALFHIQCLTLFSGRSYRLQRPGK